MESTSSGRRTSFEGVWHRAVRTDWAWRHGLFYWGGFVLVWILFEILRRQYYSSAGVIYISNPLATVLGSATGCAIVIFPLAYWLDRNKVPAMVRFDESGLAMRLKNGLVIEAGWNLVKRVRYERWGKLTIIRLRGELSPFTGNLPAGVGEAMAAKLARMREIPQEPTLEEKVDGRLSADSRL